MWIVNLALKRPYTFIVLAIFILIAGVLSILSTPKDIFPSINIPVISVIWNFTGMAPEEVEQHITSPYERVLTTTVDNIEHIESQSLYGIAVVKIFLQPNASVPAGIAQVIRAELCSDPAHHSSRRGHSLPIRRKAKVRGSGPQL